MHSPSFSARVVRRRFFNARRDGSALTDASRDGVVEFRVSATPGGLALERRQFRMGIGLSIHAMCFEDEASFVRWCDADDLQFTFPLVCARLKRRGCALLSPQRTAPPPP